MKPLLLTVIIRVLFAPAPVRIDGHATLYYELSLTNNSEDTIRLNTLTAFDAKDSLPIFTAKDAELRKRLGSNSTGNLHHAAIREFMSK